MTNRERNCRFLEPVVAMHEREVGAIELPNPSQPRAGVERRQRCLSMMTKTTTPWANPKQLRWDDRSQVNGMMAVWAKATSSASEPIAASEKENTVDTARLRSRWQDSVHWGLK